MLTTKINGVAYHVREQFDMVLTHGDGQTFRRREPSLHRCGCCGTCPYVEQYHEEVHSLAEAIKRGWLVKAEHDTP